MLKSWPGLNGLEVAKINKADCMNWAGNHRKTSSASSFNNTVTRTDWNKVLATGGPGRKSRKHQRFLWERNQIGNINLKWRHE